MATDPDQHEGEDQGEPEEQVEDTSQPVEDPLTAENLEEDGYVVEGVPRGDSTEEQEFINAKGIHFKQVEKSHESHMRPYGLSCVHRVTAYLAKSINPHEKRRSENTNLIGLKLVATAMECGAAHLESAPLVMNVVKDDLCRSLFVVSSSRDHYGNKMATMLLAFCNNLCRSLKGTTSPCFHTLSTTVSCYLKQIVTT